MDLKFANWAHPGPNTLYLLTVGSKPEFCTDHDLTRYQIESELESRFNLWNPSDCTFGFQNWQLKPCQIIIQHAIETRCNITLTKWNTVPFTYKENRYKVTRVKGTQNQSPDFYPIEIESDMKVTGPSTCRIDGAACAKIGTKCSRR